MREIYPPEMVPSVASSKIPGSRSDNEGDAQSWERQGAGTEVDRLNAGEKNFYKVLQPFNHLDKAQFMETIDTQLSLIESGYFPDPDYKDRVLALRERVLVLDKGYTCDTVDTMFGSKTADIFPTPLGSTIDYHLRDAYRDNKIN